MQCNPLGGAQMRCTVLNKKKYSANKEKKTTTISKLNLVKLCKITRSAEKKEMTPTQTAEKII